MYLLRTNCIICGENIGKIRYNLKSTLSRKSNVLLITLVEKIYKNIVFLHCNICTTCYELLNELDDIQHKLKELFQTLKQRLSDNLNEFIPNDTLDFDSDLLKISNTYSEQPNRKKDSDTTREEEITQKNEEIDLPDIDLKKLPIKIKRITSNQGGMDIQTLSPGNNVSRKKSKNEASQNEKVFEQIQTNIQMDLSKHIAQQINRSVPIKNVLCEICGQKFVTKPGYENHMKKHSNVEDEIKLLSLNRVEKSVWFCDICGKNFNQKVGLVRHRSIHTGEHRYQCEQCGKKFFHHSSFNMHRKIHMGKRDFKCEICNHGFLTNSHLKRHVRSAHAKEKRHVCEICNKKFSENYNLIAHIKTVHNKPIQEHKEEESADLFYQMQDTDIAKEVLIEENIHCDRSTILYDV